MGEILGRDLHIYSHLILTTILKDGFLIPILQIRILRLRKLPNQEHKASECWDGKRGDLKHHTGSVYIGFEGLPIVLLIYELEAVKSWTIPLVTS